LHERSALDEEAILVDIKYSLGASYFNYLIMMSDNGVFYQ